MQVTLDTMVLQRMATQISRAVGASRILPVTGYVRLVLEDGVLSMTATDAAVFATARAVVAGDPGSIVVKADALLKLIEKTVVETMTLTTVNNELQIRGHGKYRQPGYTAEPFPQSPITMWEARGTINSSLLKARMAMAACAVARELVEPQLTGYWWGENLVTTDNMRAAVGTMPLAIDPPVLLAAPVAELLGQFLADEDVTVETSAHHVRFTSDSLIVEGPELLGIERYPQIGSLLDLAMTGQVTLPVGQLQEAVERVHLFADPLNSYAVALTIGDDVAVQAGETVERIGISGADGRATLHLNSEYWLRLLRICEDEVTLRWATDDAPLRMDVAPGVTVFLGTVQADE